MNTAFLVFRPAAAPAPQVSHKAADDLVRLFALDRLPVRRQLICHWQRDAAGRLIGVWETELVHARHR